tara:strand:- start:536 stop:811 length:276 start_codon:yes stop_codon:yes gene_type:complete
MYNNEYAIEDYKQLIANIINRLQKENCIIIKENKTTSNQIIYRIMIKPVEWYLELDDDTKYNVETNLQKFMKPKIQEIIQELNLPNNSKII